MGRFIRRTLTITITETLTIVWTPEDEPACQMPTVLQVQPQITEERDGKIPAALGDACFDNPHNLKLDHKKQISSKLI